MKSEFLLKRSVLYEKCDSKNYILNSDKYLVSLGIGIYIYTEDSSKSHKGRVYSSPSNKSNLGKILKLYSEQEMVDFYKTFTANPKLKKLSHNPYDVSQIDNKVFINNNNVHHKKYVGNLLKNKHGDNQCFLIYCNSSEIIRTAGYVTLNSYNQL